MESLREFLCIEESAWFNSDNTHSLQCRYHRIFNSVSGLDVHRFFCLGFRDFCFKLQTALFFIRTARSSICNACRFSRLVAFLYKIAIIAVGFTRADKAELAAYLFWTIGIDWTLTDGSAKSQHSWLIMVIGQSGVQFGL